MIDHTIWKALADLNNWMVETDRKVAEHDRKIENSAKRESNNWERVAELEKAVAYLKKLLGELGLEVAKDKKKFEDELAAARFAFVAAEKNSEKLARELRALATATGWSVDTDEPDGVSQVNDDWPEGY